jgi:hypothetical protein
MTEQQTFDSLEALQAAADGTPVAVFDTSGRFAEFTKAATGLAQNGVTVPWSLFTGSVKQGLVRDNTHREPQAGEWWNNGRWWFYIARRNGEQIWHATIETQSNNTFQVNNWYASVPVGDFIARQTRTKADESAVPETLRHPLFVNLLNQYHASRRDIEAQAEKVNEATRVSNATFRERLTQVAAQQSSPDLDSVLASVGWGRPRNLPVNVTIAGTCYVDGGSMASLLSTPGLGGDGETGFTVSRTLVRFSRTVRIEVPITDGNECLCGRNYREKVAAYFPANPHSVSTTARCTNH